MIDIKHFTDNYYEPLESLTRSAVSEVKSYRRGGDLLAGDLASGYVSGTKAKETSAIMEDARISAQGRFRPTAESFRVEALQYVDKAFALKPEVAAELAPILPLLGNDEAAYKNLAKQYHDNYTALTLIAKEAIKNDLWWGSFLDQHLAEYKSECEKKLPGLADTATNAVLGRADNWEGVMYSKMKSVERARDNLDVFTGVKEPAVDKSVALIHGALENAMWAS